jgi:hypothetical protein
MAGEEQNGQFKMDMAEFKGFVKATLKTIEETTAAKLEAYEKVTQEQVRAIEAGRKLNYECICSMREDLSELKEEIAVSSAVRKVKDGLWGAIGGGSMAIAVMLAKDFLKSKFFGGGQ